MVSESERSIQEDKGDGRMVDERWQSFWGSSEEPDEQVAQMVIDNLEAALDEGSNYHDMMYGAYLRVTDIPPDEVVL